MPKVILISGGSDGLGKAMAEKLAPDNRVVILSHNREKLQAVARELNCDFVEAELTDYESLKTAVNQIIEKHETIDVLINNAGIWMEGELEDNDPKKIKEVIDVNTTGTIFLTRAVLPGMRFRKSGQIINIISQDGLCAKKNRSVYHASKWALTGFTKCIQEDLEEENIKVTGIYPGLLKTNLFAKNGVDRDLTDALEPSEVAKLVETVINLSPNTHIPELSIKNKQTNMDDTNAPVIDLNIDPNMIAAQDDSPQAAPPVAALAPDPTPPVKNPGVIDITPGSPDVFPSTPPSTHIDSAPLSEPKIQDITPPATTPDSLSHLADVSPEPLPETTPLSTPAPSIAPTPQDLTPQAEPQVPDSSAPIAPVPTPTETEQDLPSSPLAEDPDLVKLIK